MTGLTKNAGRSVYDRRGPEKAGQGNRYVNLASDQPGGGHVFVVNGQGEKFYNAVGATGFPFFGQLILDCLNRTENAMTQEHAFRAAELCLIAQRDAVRIK